MIEVEKIINEFQPISLNEMDEVKLMSRNDTKFAFRSSILPQLLNQMHPFYRVLSIDGLKIHDYKSLYFDTKERKFYLDHHNRRVNRNKIRFREYVGSKLTFLEIKLKNNKGRTIKKRTKVKKINEHLSEENKSYIKKVIGHGIEVEAKQWINFSRVTFVHIKDKERLTMDLNLTYHDKNDKGDLKKIIIAEVKQEKMSRKSDFMRIAKELSILPIRISKYCISTLKLNPVVKSNRFKEKVLFLNKLISN